MARTVCFGVGRLPSEHGGNSSAGYGLLVAASSENFHLSKQFCAIFYSGSQHTVLFLEKNLLLWIAGNLCTGTATPLGCSWKNKDTPSRRRILKATQ